MSIAHAIEHKAGRYVTLPDADPARPRKWLSFRCPFCDGDRAAVNYALNCFKCPHASCPVTTIWAREKYADPRTELAHRYKFQLRQAVRNVTGRYGGWLDRHRRQDVWQFARQRLYEYEASGELDRWDMDVKGDPNQMDRFVLQALNGDLANWADSIKRKISKDDLKHEASSFDPDIVNARPADPGRLEKKDQIARRITVKSRDDDPTGNSVIWVSWPVLDLAIRHGLTGSEIARRMEISERTVQRRFADEMDEAKQAYGSMT